MAERGLAAVGEALRGSSAGYGDGDVVGLGDEVGLGGGVGLGVGGGWALVVVGATLSRVSPELIPPRFEGGPDPSFLSGAVWAARMVAGVGDLAITAGMGDAPEAVDLGLALNSGRAPDPGPDAVPGATLEPVRARARAIVERSTAALAAAAVHGDFPAQAAAELAALLPGGDPEVAGAALCAAGAWLIDDAPAVTAALNTRRGFGRGPLRYSPDGCGFSGTLLAQAGLALLG